MTIDKAGEFFSSIHVSHARKILASGLVTTCATDDASGRVLKYLEEIRASVELITAEIAIHYKSFTNYLLIVPFSSSQETHQFAS